MAIVFFSSHCLFMLFYRRRYSISPLCSHGLLSYCRKDCAPVLTSRTFRPLVLTKLDRSTTNERTINFTSALEMRATGLEANSGRHTDRDCRNGMSPIISYRPARYRRSGATTLLSPSGDGSKLLSSGRSGME